MNPRNELSLAVAGCTLAGVTLLLMADGDAADAWGWVALAGVVAIAATRRVTRALVGVALAAAGVAALGANVLGGAVLAATGALVAVRGPRWPALGSRYDAPAKREDPWAVLDRGDDPTL